MTSDSETKETPAAWDVEALPGRVADDATILVATQGDPSRFAIGLRLLDTFGTGADSAFVVTTTRSDETTVDVYEAVSDDTDRPALGMVDTSSEQQSISALYDEVPVVFTPSSGDIEHLVLALSELTEKVPSPDGERHLLVRSLTPILTATSTERVCTVLERVAGIRSDGGLSLLGIDYTAHDEETMQAIADHADGIVWVERAGPDRLAVEYQPMRSRRRLADSGSESDA
jgi:hypothetical protein